MLPFSDHAFVPELAFQILCLLFSERLPLHSFFYLHLSDFPLFEVFNALFVDLISIAHGLEIRLIPLHFSLILFHSP